MLVASNNAQDTLKVTRKALAIHAAKIVKRNASYNGWTNHMLRFMQKLNTWHAGYFIIQLVKKALQSGQAVGSWA